MADDPLMTSVTAELDLAINKARCCCGLVVELRRLE